jgi:hypothetical protein
VLAVFVFCVVVLPLVVLADTATKDWLAAALIVSMKKGRLASSDL